jgi:copper chaperone
MEEDVNFYLTIKQNRMKIYQFKTNIQCSGCEAKVKSFLEGHPEIVRWNVDLTNPGKLLTVETSNLSPQQIVELLQQAGYKATLWENAHF